MASTDKAADERRTRAAVAAAIFVEEVQAERDGETLTGGAAVDALFKKTATLKSAKMRTAVPPNEPQCCSSEWQCSRKADGDEDTSTAWLWYASPGQLEYQGGGVWEYSPNKHQFGLGYPDDTNVLSAEENDTYTFDPYTLDAAMIAVRRALYNLQQPVGFSFQGCELKRFRRKRRSEKDAAAAEEETPVAKPRTE